MTPHFTGNLIGGLLAVAVPLGALLATGEVGAPFAWARLLVVHLLATLPLALLLAAALARGKRTNPWLWAVVGAGLAVVTFVTAGQREDPLASRPGRQETGLLALREDPRLAGRPAWQALAFVSKALARVGWCLLLQLPWCLLGRGLSVPVPACGRRAAWPAFALAALVAVAPPWVYAQGLVEAQSRRVEELMQRQRPLQARPVVEGLIALGSTRPLAGLAPDEFGRELRDEIRRMTAAVARPLPAKAPHALRVRRAELLAVLDRSAEAERELALVPESNVDALLLRAALLRDQARWEESTGHYRRALALLANEPAPGLATAQRRVRAYDGIAFTARERQAYQEAEDSYREALAKVPAARAHFHFQLGRHYQAGGRPDLALHHLETAARLDPAGYADQAKPLIARLQSHTPGCLLRRSSP